jgi:hypothetical protein
MIELFAFNLPLKSIDPIIVNMEKIFFNPIGYIPFVGGVCAQLRCLMGIAQVVVGIALFCFHVINASILSKLDRRDVEVGRAVSVLKNVAWHGICNIVRAQFEFFPLINLVCLYYDTYGIPFVEDGGANLDIFQFYKKRQIYTCEKGAASYAYT